MAALLHAETMHEEFKRIRDLSEASGYSVFKGMKEYGVSVPTSFLEEETKKDVEMTEDGDQEEENAGNKPIMSKDLILCSAVL